MDISEQITVPEIIAMIDAPHSIRNSPQMETLLVRAKKVARALEARVHELADTTARPSEGI
jgi:hypothetical protein